MFFTRDQEYQLVTQDDITQENRVIIIVWHPKINEEDATAKEVIKEVRIARNAGEYADVSVGHVAISTPNKYISLWPGEASKGKYKVIDADYHTFLQDILSENRKPDIIITLYSLDAAVIEDGFKAVKESDDSFKG